MSLWKRLRRLDIQVPAPVAAIILVLAFCVAIVAVGTDWSTRGLPQKGEPGRYDAELARYYPQWRRQREAERARLLKEHPEFVGLSPFEIQARLRERAGR